MFISYNYDLISFCPLTCAYTSMHSTPSLTMLNTEIDTPKLVLVRIVPHSKWNAFGFSVHVRTLNCVVFIHIQTACRMMPNGGQRERERRSENERSIYTIEITITHIIAFTITINYPNIVKILLLSKWASKFIENRALVYTISRTTIKWNILSPVIEECLWNNRQFTIRVVVYIMRRHIVGSCTCRFEWAACVIRIPFFQFVSLCLSAALTLRLDGS